MLQGQATKTDGGLVDCNLPKQLKFNIATVVDYVTGCFSLRPLLQRFTTMTEVHTGKIRFERIVT